MIDEAENKRTCYLIGTFGNDKIRNELYLAGVEIIARNLTSSPKNWDKVINELTKHRSDISFVLLSLSESVLLIAHCNEYRQRFDSIINLIESYPHIVFLYEDNCFSKFNIFNTHYYQKYLYYNFYWKDLEKYTLLVRDYKTKANSKEEQLKERYFIDVALPALFLADESAWKSIIRQEVIISDAISRLSQKYNIDPVYSFHQKLDIDSSIESGWIFFDTEEHDDSSEEVIASPFHFDDKELPFTDSPEDYRTRFERDFSELNEALRFSKKELKSFKKNANKSELLRNKCLECAKGYYSANASSLLSFIINLLIQPDVLNQIDNNSNLKKYKWLVYPTYRNHYFLNEDNVIKTTIESINDIIDNVYSKNLNIVTYKSSTEVVRNIREFIIELDNNILFKQYILNDQPFADEFEYFLSLFQEYAIRIRGIDISFEKTNTESGTVYTFISKDKDILRDNFNEIIDEFREFIDFCDNNDEKNIRDMLISYGLDEKKVEHYASRFRKNARRIMVDIRQEGERRIMDLRHSLENEIMENEAPVSEDAMSSSHLEESFSSIIGNGPNRLSGSLVKPNYGFNKMDIKIIEYINHYSNDRDELITEIKILKDRNVGEDQRQRSYNKLRQFLDKNIRSIEREQFEALSNYLTDLLL